MSLLPKLMEVGGVKDSNQEWAENQKVAIKFIEATLEVYFDNLEYDPLEEGIE